MLSLTLKESIIFFDNKYYSHAIINFLDVKHFEKTISLLLVSLEKNRLVGVYTNFITFIPLEYKFGLVHILLNRCFNLSSDFLKFHHEVDKLKKILSKNAYPQKLIDKCIQKFLNNMFIQRLQIPSVTKKELIITLPYLVKLPQIVKARLTKTMNKHMKFCKLRVIFQTNNRLRNYFRFKDSVHETLRSNLIYKFSCGN